MTLSEETKEDKMENVHQEKNELKTIVMSIIED